MAPCGGKRGPAAKKPVAFDSAIENASATSGPATALRAPQEVHKDRLSDGDTKFGAMENDETRVPLETPIWHQFGLSLLNSVQCILL